MAMRDQNKNGAPKFSWGETVSNGSAARLSITDMRRTLRHTADFSAECEHPVLGSLHLHVRDISPQGFMAEGTRRLERGERIIVRLPAAGRIEALLVWLDGNQGGLQFERVLRPDEFQKLIETIRGKTKPHSGD